MPDKLNLKAARETGRLDEFIREREGERGDAEALSRVVSSMAGKSSEAPKASSRRSGDG
jgi:hypothetical protein